MSLVAHVDDILTIGEEENLKWLKKELSRVFTLKSKVTGPDQDDDKETTFLGRRLHWTLGGLTWEADEKHVAKLLTEANMTECNAVSTPIAASVFVDQAPGDRERRPLMSPDAARKHRGVCATINYLSQDRPDVSVLACELAKTMASPRLGDEAMVKRGLRYLRGRPRAATLFRFAAKSDVINLWTDSDWANCRSTRRSHSGGVLRLGSHPVKHWCRTQSRVAISSGEAEFLSAYAGYPEMIQLVHVLRELHGEDYGKVHHCVDASACASLLQRRGTGSVKHLETKELWTQEVVRRFGVRVLKVGRVKNSSDVVASPTAPAEFDSHLAALELVFLGSNEQEDLAQVRAHLRAHPRAREA